VASCDLTRQPSSATFPNLPSKPDKNKEPLPPLSFTRFFTPPQIKTPNYILHIVPHPRPTATMSDLFLSLVHVLWPAIRPLDRLVGHSIDSVGTFAYTNFRTPVLSFLRFPLWVCEAIDSFFVWFIWGGTVIQGFVIPLLWLYAVFVFARIVTSDHPPARIAKIGRNALVVLFIFTLLLWLVDTVRAVITTPEKFKLIRWPVSEAPAHAPSLTDSIFRDSIFPDPPKKSSSWRNDLEVELTDFFFLYYVQPKDAFFFYYVQLKDAFFFYYVQLKDFFFPYYVDYHRFRFHQGLQDGFKLRRLFPLPGLQEILTDIVAAAETDWDWINYFLARFGFGLYFFLELRYLPRDWTRFFTVFIAFLHFLYLDLFMHPLPSLNPPINIIYWAIYLLGLDSPPTTLRSTLHSLATLGWSETPHLVGLDFPAFVHSLLTQYFAKLSLFLALHDVIMYVFAHPLPVVLWFFTDMEWPVFLGVTAMLYVIQAWMGHLVLRGLYPRELQPGHGMFWRAHRLLAHGSVGSIVAGAVVLFVDRLKIFGVGETVAEAVLMAGGLALFLDRFGWWRAGLVGLMVILGTGLFMTE
jgi:hypothetical protein